MSIAGMAGAALGLALGVAPATPAHIAVDGVGQWPVQSTGLAPDGTLAPDPGEVAWYDASPLPGDDGVAVIVGHVTMDGAPDVFYALGGAEPGAWVDVTDDAGTVRSWRVAQVEQVTKADLAADPKLWGPRDEPALALVTCDAASPVGAGRHFTGNTVVYLDPSTYRVRVP